MSATIVDPETTQDASRSASLPHAIVAAESMRTPRGADLSADHVQCDTHSATVGVELSSDHIPYEAQHMIVAAELRFHAAFLDDIENVRKATANRLGAMERQGVGGTQYQSQLDALEKLEHLAVLALQRAMRKHPLGPWVKATIGIGEKQAARLLAAIGDVTWNHAENRPRRGPAELWAYCGYRPDQKRKKGVQSNWNADAKMRAFLIAQSCIKQRCTACTQAGKIAEEACWQPPPTTCACVADGYPYRVVYDQARLSWIGCDTTDLHKQNHALRCVAKAVLKDMFLEARRLAPDHEGHGSHQCFVGSTA